MDKFENFIKWISLKFKVNKNQRRPFFNEREIWWANFGLNVGDEENGKGDGFMRPVLVLKKFNHNICLVVPLSSVIKENMYYHTININSKQQSFLISQIRTIDTKRFTKRKEKLTPKEFNELKIMVKQIIFE